jgi:hypothetical protein
MPIDIKYEQLVSLSFARRYIIPKVGGRSISPCTLWRWIHRGLQTPDGGRVRLEVLYRGKAPMTTTRAIAHFFEALTEAKLRHTELNECQRSAETEAALRAKDLMPS